MFRMWGKIWKDGHLLADHVAAIGDDDTRTHKVFRSLAEICHTLDLESPIWLDARVREFQRHGKTKFGHDSFIEDVPFDYLEIEIIEE